MNFISLFFISIGLSMDTFAVSLTEGIILKELRMKYVLKIAIVFGLFQGLMPLIGWKLGLIFYDKIESMSHIIAFILLVFMGGKMILDTKNPKENSDNPKKEKNNIFILGIATSIDTLIVGFSFSMLPGTSIYISVLEMSIVTFILSCVGVYFGNKTGKLLENKAEYLGGFILIIMGIKSLI